MHDKASNRRTLGVRQIDLASAHIASNEIVRDINRDIILELIRFKQPLARVELSRLSGLRRSTVSAIVQQLIQENWVTEGAVVKPARGRPSTMISVNDTMVTFALDLRPNRAILAVVDLSGRFLSRETIATETDPRKTILQIGNRMRALRKEYALKSFKGVGVSFPGRVQPAKQRILLAANMNWHEFDLKKAIEQVSGLQVEIDNDANVCLISELWFGRLEGAKNVVLVAVAEGVGTAILTGGHMYSGYNGLAGEFGHVSVDPSGPLCQCGQKGCWEMAASSRAAMRTFNARSKRRVKNIHELLQLGQKGDPNAVYALKEQARALGRGMRLITATLSPELILVVGDITTVWELCGPIVAQELRTSMLAGTPPLLRATGDAELARLSGSAAMLMQRHANYHRSTHETSGPTIKHR
ncbi:MAG: ROK family protein [Edaphobacter sp.]